VSPGTDLFEAVKTLWGEARGERYEAKAAVFHVLLERQAVAKAYKLRTGKNHPLFGDGTLTGVCLAPYQFSCRNANDPNAAKIAALSLPDALGDAAFLDCLGAANAALTGREKAAAPGVLHYHVAGMDPLPKWAIGQKPVAHIGAHVFYNNIG
jgi:N-acetylmuramoyl-L-alanine amidase